MVLQGQRFQRAWGDLKSLWNDFRAFKGGFVQNECVPNSAFSPLSDQTSLATFLGYNNEDNEVVKVLKALISIQVMHPYMLYHTNKRLFT